MAKRNVQLIIEKYLSSTKKYGDMIDIFVNPDRSEMKELGDSIRFIADATGEKVYCWNSTKPLIHGDAWVFLKKEINDNRSLYKSTDIITGEWFKEGNRVDLNALPSLHQDIRRGLAASNWKWLEKWFDISDDLRRYGK